jgi:hypothetical protein
MYDVSIHGHVTDVLDELYGEYVHRLADPSQDVQMHDASIAVFLLNPARKRFLPRDARLVADDSSGGKSFAYRYVRCVWGQELCVSLCEVWGSVCVGGG